MKKKKTETSDNPSPLKTFNDEASDFLRKDDSIYNEATTLYAVLDLISEEDFQDMELEMLCTLAALRSIGPAEEKTIALEAERLFEHALGKMRQEFFGNGDLSAFNVKSGGDNFAAGLRGLLTGYVSGETPIPSADFFNVEIDTGIKRVLN